MERDVPREVGGGRPHDTERPDIVTSSDEYANGRFGGAIGRWLLDEQARAMTALLDHIGGRSLRVLDLGGGHGQLTRLFVARGHDIVVHGSTDGCFGRLESLRRAHPHRVSASVSSLWNLPFADRLFDLVVAIRVFGHVVRWRELVAEMTRVSRQYVVIEFARARPTSSNILPGVGDAVFGLKRLVEKSTRPYFTYREDTLTTALTVHGFSPVAVRGQFAMPMALHRMGRSPVASRAIEGTLRHIGIGARFRSPALLLAERAPDRAETNEARR